MTSGDDGTSIPGVSVVVKGSTLGTITDMDGKFTLKVPQGAKTLSVTFVGMSATEVALTSASNYKVVMQSESVSVDEVVVTALGITRAKKSLGYAVQDVKSAELTKSAQSNVISSLNGKVAGVQINQAGGQIGASSRIVIRGNSSFGDNQPLIVVDGIPYGNNSTTANAVDYGSGLYDINPEDIESVSVLKGGSAALYGMRAGHGVILITTKSGKNKQKVFLSLMTEILILTRYTAYRGCKISMARVTWAMNLSIKQLKAMDSKVHTSNLQKEIMTRDMDLAIWMV